MEKQMNSFPPFLQLLIFLLILLCQDFSFLSDRIFYIHKQFKEISQSLLSKQVSFFDDSFPRRNRLYLLNIDSTDKEKEKAEDNLGYLQKHNIFTAIFSVKLTSENEVGISEGKKQGFICGRNLNYFIDTLTPETQFKIADTLKD